MKTGLTLGKYAPLHRGHQLLIETALAENNHVIVLIYDCPEVTNYPLGMRAGWIRTLYPEVEVIEAWDGPTEIGDTAEIKQMHEKYILSVLDRRQIDAFYSSEFYGEHVSKALGAKDRRIDPKRLKLPVSGKAIRKNAYLHRKYLDPIVYRDLIMKVVFLGAPSTGKTTIAEKLALEFNTVWMPEFGREYWDKHQINRRLSKEQLVEIAEGHVEREETLFQKANRFIFIDTDATTTWMFSENYHNTTHPKLDDLARKTLARYDIFFLCGDEFSYDDTWDRSGEANRTIFQKKIKSDLLKRRIPFIDITGPTSVRIKKVKNYLQSFEKFEVAG